jgi:hypothetical protein
VARGSRRLHNEELHKLYASADFIRAMKSRRVRWVGHVAGMGKIRNAYNTLVGKSEGKRPLGKHRSRWEYNITMVLRKIGW